MGIFDIFEEATEFEGTGIGIWIPLNSSFIAAAKWTPDIVRSILDLNISGTVDIQFRNGGGDSESCTLGEFIAFVTAGSPGAYYNANFK